MSENWRSTGVAAVKAASAQRRNRVERSLLADRSSPARLLACLASAARGTRPLGSAASIVVSLQSFFSHALALLVGHGYATGDRTLRCGPVPELCVEVMRAA